MGLKQDNNPENHTVDNDNSDDIADDINIKSEEVNYIVETLIAPEDIKRLFIDQEVVIPTQILTDIRGTLTKNEASASEKLKLLKEYQSIINEYKLNNKINIYGDYQSSLISEQRKENQNKILTR